MQKTNISFTTQAQDKKGGWSKFKMFNKKWKTKQHWGRFVEQKLKLSYSFKCDHLSQIWFVSDFVVLLKSDLDVQQTHLWKQNEVQPVNPTKMNKIKMDKYSIPPFENKTTIEIILIYT